MIDQSEEQWREEVWAEFETLPFNTALERNSEGNYKSSITQRAWKNYLARACRDRDAIRFWQRCADSSQDKLNDVNLLNTRLSVRNWELEEEIKKLKEAALDQADRFDKILMSQKIKIDERDELLNRVYQYENPFCGEPYRSGVTHICWSKKDDADVYVKIERLESELDKYKRAYEVLRDGIGSYDYDCGCHVCEAAKKAQEIIDGK